VAVESIPAVNGIPAVASGHAACFCHPCCCLLSTFVDILLLLAFQAFLLLLVFWLLLDSCRCLRPSCKIVSLLLQVLILPVQSVHIGNFLQFFRWPGGVLFLAYRKKIASFRNQSTLK
jgi:hypothetical protein